MRDTPLNNSRHCRGAFRCLLSAVVAAAMLGIPLAAGEQPSSADDGDDATWWSWAPLVPPRIPAIPAESSGWARTPLDAFVLAQLKRQRLGPSPAADRLTLIRRVTIDLVGLPPTPEAIDAFLADPAHDAYERLVESLLSSPHHGERWARHWLDIVHYGDTHGYDKDKPRPNAWPYRDYVVRAFNGDKPYPRFVREQLAGDMLYPDTRDGVVATGFIAAGPWDFIGHAEVPESKLDGQVARHLDRDDMVRTAMNSFVSLTVQCARCHDHKFDPVTMEDYYSLQAVFAALDRADRPYDPDPAAAARRAQLARDRVRIEGELAGLDRELVDRGGDRLVQLERALDKLGRSGNPPPRNEFGYHSRIMPRGDQARWIQVDLGESQRLAHVVIVGCHDDFNNIGAGFGFPPRFRVDVSDDARFQAGVTCLADHSRVDFPNPGVRPLSFPAGGRRARYIRVTATRLAHRKNDYIFALAELAAISADGRNLASGRPVTALDSIEAAPRWQRANLVDGFYDRVEASPGLLARVVELSGRWRRLRKQLVTPDWQRRRDQLQRRLIKVRQDAASIPAPQLVYAGTVHRGSGSFRGTGHDGGRPRPIHVLLRGDIRQPNRLVGPGTIPVANLPARFDLADGHAEGTRRVALAEWIVDRRNPLTWRSIANRVWQYHIGRPLVDTPNDFGRIGGEPSHPQLLDWLACRLRDGSGSLKDLHRQIVISATYRQSSFDRPVAARHDSGNRWLWRMNRRRIEAEVVRDTVLAVSGRLNLQMYGPGFQDFVIDKPEHSPHYEYDRHDPDDVRTHRRSIYRFLVRSQQQPFMTTLDCADPSRMVARRNESISPLQALAMLNNRFMTTMAGRFAERVESERRDLPGRVTRAFRLALGRRPSQSELTLLGDYARKHGMANTCRLILNLNEFTFVN